MNSNRAEELVEEKDCLAFQQNFCYYTRTFSSSELKLLYFISPRYIRLLFSSQQFMIQFSAQVISLSTENGINVVEIGILFIECIIYLI
jgi:hypothetical protein